MTNGCGCKNRKEEEKKHTDECGCHGAKKTATNNQWGK